MKKATVMLMAMLLLLGGLSLKAQITETNSFTNLNEAIPDGNASGLHDVRAISSAIPHLSSVRLRLRVTGEFNGDLYGYVRHIRGGATNFCVLLNRPGRTAANPAGYADAGLDVVFDDAAVAGDIHRYKTNTIPPAGTPLTGTWQPDGRRVDPEVVLDTTARTATLSSFTNADGSGEWTLFLADLASGGTNMLVNWELQLTGIATPAVSWPIPGNIVYGTALGSAQLNASSPVPGTFSYSPPAGAVLNAGSNQTLSVTFKPTDTNSYSSVTNTVSINVLKVPLTITASNTNKVYGQTVTFAGTEFTGSGLVNSDTVTSVTLNSAGTGSTAAASGSPYSIVPSAAAGTGLGNYTIGYVNGTLTVSNKALTITANNTNKVYGQTVTFAGTEFTRSGLVNSDTVTSVNLNSAGTGSTAAVSGSPYSIVPSAATGTGLANYTIGYVNGTLTVSNKALTITANNTNKVYGQTVTFAGTEFTGSGLVNSDTVTSVALNSAGTGSTAAVSGSPYSIVPSAAAGTGLANYTIGYVNGTLTITKAGTMGTLSSSSNPSPPSQSVVFTLALSAVAPGLGTPSSTVQFKIDGTNAGAPVPLSGGTASSTPASLAHGTHMVVAEYGGDGNFTGTTNLLSPAQLINTPPMPGIVTIERDPTNGTKVSIALIVTNCSETDGDLIAFLGASTNSANGGTVVTNSGWVFYTPAPGFTNSDTFTYTISDGWGAPVTGTVTVNVRTNTGPSPNLTISDLGSGVYAIRGDGIADRTYRIQFTDNAQHTNWATLGTALADPFGVFQIIDTNGVPQRFYRSVYP